MFTAKLSLIPILLLIIFTLLPLFVQAAPVLEKNTKRNNIIYTRYVRRRPSEYPSDLYVDDFVEIFRVHQKQTPSYLLSDDEVDRIIRCDFDPQLKECEDLPGKSTVRSVVTTTEASTIWLPTIATSDDGYSTTVPLASTTTTTQTPAAATTTTTQAPLSTTTEDLPFLPDIPTSAEEPATTSKDSTAAYLTSTPETNEIAGNIEENDYYIDDYEDNEDTYDKK